MTCPSTLPRPVDRQCLVIDGSTGKRQEVAPLPAGGDGKLAAAGLH